MVPAFRGTAWSVIAIALGTSALVASCSAGVDGYHLEGLSGTGGAQSGGGGNDASVTGGSSGSAGATGGSGNTTGGAGASGGTGAMGGVPTGGSAGTGGTGGASGGAGTAGTGGGTGVWPAAPKLVPLDNTTLSGITAGAWDASNQQFLLLEPANNRFWKVDPKLNTSGQAQVSGPVTFTPNTAGSVASKVFGLNSTSVFVVFDGALNLLDPLTGSTKNSFALSGSPSQGDLSGAHASNTFFIGNNVGSTYVLTDGATSFTANGLQNIGTVATDGTSFAFRMVMNVSDSTIHVTSAASIAALSSPCNDGTFPQNTNPISVFGNTVSWVKSNPTKLEWHVATVASGACTDRPTPMQFGTASAGPFPVGLLSDSYALVCPAVNNASITVQILGLVTAPTTDTGYFNVGTGGGAEFVVASGPMPHYAVLVGNIPGLITF